MNMGIPETLICVWAMYNLVHFVLDMIPPASFENILMRGLHTGAVLLIAWMWLT